MRKIGGWIQKYRLFFAKYAPPPPPPPPTHHNKGTGRRGSKFPNHKTSKIATKTIGPTRRVLQGTLLWGINYLKYGKFKIYAP